MLAISKIVTNDLYSFILKKVVERKNVIIEDAQKDTNKNANSSNIGASANMDLIVSSNAMRKMRMRINLTIKMKTLQI